MALDDTRVTPAHLRNDGQNYHPTHRLVLFGHHFAAITGRRPAHRPGARGAVRLGAGPHLARLRASAWPARSTTSSSSGPRPAGAGARWRRSPAKRSARWRAPPRPSPSSSSSSSPWPASGSPSSTRFRRAPGARSRSACRFRSRCSWASTCTGSARAGSPRRPTIGVIGLLLAVIARQAGRGVGDRPLVPAVARTAHRGDGRLRVRRLGAAGVAAALPARLSQLVHEDRHDRVPRGRGDDRQPDAADAGRVRSSSPAADRSFPARSSRSPSSRSPAARSRASTRSSRRARRRR